MRSLATYIAYIIHNNTLQLSIMTMTMSFSLTIYTYSYIWFLTCTLRIYFEHCFHCLFRPWSAPINKIKVFSNDPKVWSEFFQNFFINGCSMFKSLKCSNINSHKNHSTISFLGLLLTCVWLIACLKCWLTKSALLKFVQYIHCLFHLILLHSLHSHKSPNRAIFVEFIKLKK